MAEWKPKVGDKVRFESDGTPGSPRWNFTGETGCEGHFTEATIISVGDSGCHNCRLPEHFTFFFTWINSLGEHSEWGHCTCCTGPGYPGAPGPIDGPGVKPAAGQCSCDTMHIVNNGCPSVRGLPCPDVKFERY